MVELETVIQTEFESVEPEDPSLGPSRTTPYTCEENMVIGLQLAFWSMIGVLLRMWLNMFHTLPYWPVSSSLYPQVIGCFIIGWIISFKESLMTRHRQFYLGITTGLCGSITTFSGAMRDVYFQFSYPIGLRGAGYNFLGAIAIIALTFGMARAATLCGSHIAMIPGTSPIRILDILTDFMRRVWKSKLISSNLALWFGITVVTYISFLLLVILLRDWRVWSISVLFAPFGTYLRYFLSGWNTRMSQFPLGTYVANTIASIVIFITILIQPKVAYSDDASAIILAVANGFCGCLSTVSTMSIELATLDVPHAYKYALISIGTAQLFGMFLLGIPSWTGYFI